jgi:hypothetical protein
MVAGCGLAIWLAVAPGSAQVPGGAGLPPTPGTFGAPADYDFRRPKAENLASQAFTLDLDADGPMEVVRVVEQRQITLGRPVYAVTARNRSEDAVKAYTVAAVVVGRDGTVKGMQRLPPVSNLKPGQERKQDIQIRVALPSISDRVAFAVVDVEPAAGERWSIDEASLRAILKAILETAG